MSSTYHKIQTVYLRDPDNNYRTLLDGQFAKPEFEFLDRTHWVFTEKIDGTNIRVIWDGERVEFRGKTDRAQTPSFLMDALERDITADKMLDVFGDKGGITLYGEGYGQKIQKGHTYMPESNGFILFDVCAGSVWFAAATVQAIAASLEIPVTPTVMEGHLRDAVDLCERGFVSLIAERPAEGLVGRPAIELKTRMGERIITKIKCKDFA